MTKDLSQKIIELMDLFDDEQVTTADQIKRPERAIEKQAIDDFLKRNPQADGGRIGFKIPGLVKGTTSKTKTDEFKYPAKFKNKKTGEIETVYRKEPVPRGADRVSTKIDAYKTALNDFKNQVDDAIQSKDVSKLPKNFAQFLKDRELIGSTYYSLSSKNQLPKIETDIPKIRLNFANSLIEDANQGFKFINAETLFKNAGFTSKEYKSLYATKKLVKLDQAIDKVDKGFTALFSTKTNSKAVDLFNPIEKIAELTGLSNSKISNRLAKLDIKKQSPELHRAFRLFSNPNFKKNIKTNFPDLTLTELLSKPESFFADYAQAKAKTLRKTRIDKAVKKAGEAVVDINTAQDETIALLNKFYKDNPKELLGNTKLRNVLDLTLEDGEIVKKNKYVTDEDFLKLIKEKPGLFTKDHVDEVQFEKLSTEFPIFKQLTTYNTNSGLIKSIKTYVSKNQNSTDPLIQNKIKKQIEFLEDLKLRIDTPTGRIGSKEVLAAVDKQAGTLPNFLAQLRALNIKLPAKAKAVLLGTGGGLAATTLATAGPIEETGSTAMDTAKTAGAATAGALGVGTKTGRNILGRIIGGGFGPTGMAGLTVAGGGYDLSSPLDRLILGTEAAFAPELVKGTIGATKGMKNRALQKVVQRALNLGMSVPTALKVARVASPLGLASLAGEGIYQVGKLGFEDQKRFDALTPEQQAAERAEQEAFAFDVQGAKEGGRAGFKIGTVIDKGNKLRKGILELINKNVKSTPKDTTPELDKLIKETLDKDFFDKKDRIIDSLNVSEAKKRKNLPYNMKVFEEPSQLEFYDDITKSNFKTKTGPFFDRRKKAGGGILKQAGDSSGPPPESGPMSQGLQGLMKRGIKI